MASKNTIDTIKVIDARRHFQHSPPARFLLAQALDKYPEEGGQLKEGVAIAKMVKYGLDNEYGPYWHVTVPGGGPRVSETTSAMVQDVASEDEASTGRTGTSRSPREGHGCPK